MRRLTLAYRDRLPISETPSRISACPTPTTRPFALSGSCCAFRIGIEDRAAPVSDWLLRVDDRHGDAGEGVLPRVFIATSSTL